MLFSLISEDTYSYPSGHALGSMVLYGFIANLLADRYPNWGDRFESAVSRGSLANGRNRWLWSRVFMDYLVHYDAEFAKIRK